jgi:NTP pyrophosphatase (non-canonical NTP hydrolase)
MQSKINLANDFGVDPDGRIDPVAEDTARYGIRTLMEAVHGCAVAHGWWESGDRNFGEMIALMHSELSEALEAYRDHQPPLWYDHAGLYGADQAQASEDYEHNGVLGKPEGVASEFADVIIRIMDTCEQAGIPLAEALIRKHNFNLSRPYRHGGKAC